MGPQLIEQVLQSHGDGSLVSVPQVAAEVTVAPKLSKDRATVHFDQDACSVRNGVHGLVPWPGCTVCIGSNRLRLLKVEVLDRVETTSPPGTISPDGTISCNPGHVRLLEVQSPGRRPMSFAEWLHGHPLDDASRCSPMDSAS